MTSTSQWSLALAARKRGTTSKLLVWTPGRNGAWPWRPGKVGAAGIVFLAGEGRNGAWPWRPGKAAVDGEGIVAMEPGRGGQEKPRNRDVLRLCETVAMEPGRGGQEKGSRFFACLTTSIAHLRERWEPCGEAGGLQAAETRSKCVLTRGRALPGGGGGTGALAR